MAVNQVCVKEEIKVKKLKEVKCLEMKINKKSIHVKYLLQMINVINKYLRNIHQTNRLHFQMLVIHIKHQQRNSVS